MELLDSVSVLDGVGPKMKENLETLGIQTIEDLLTYYPFRYQDFNVKSIREIQDQEQVVIEGLVLSEPVVSYYGYRKNRMNFRMMQENAAISVTFFNQPYLAKQVTQGEDLAVFGKWDAKRQALTGIKIIKRSSEDDYAPVYHVNKQVKQSALVKFIEQALEKYEGLLVETLPDSLLTRHQLIPRAEAIRQIHFPESLESNDAARKRLVYEEFFSFQFKLEGWRFKEKAGDKSLPIEYDVSRLKEYIATLPFELTTAQKRVTNEICRDLLLPFKMNRLLQGDVGSGKTVVAAIALFATYTASFQGALMVPTEILAEQHFQSLNELFSQTDVRLGLLTGSTKTKRKQEILDELANGELDVIIGTHALIQENVLFQRLGLGIIDEQHRFGVNQRQALLNKGEHTNQLVMTATPIPRTLAITAFGELDVSIIDELPAGRKPITTRWLKPAQLPTAYEWLRTELGKNRQAYVICPLIEESEAMDLKNATEIYETIKRYYQNEYEVGLLHGKMTPDEKELVMNAFNENQVQVLVSTTVVEVGVNVPNATVMMIMDAERFGLAQLHQLRGRVGRGDAASYCLLVSNPKNETGQARMQIMTETNDGFVLSQKDLEMRGPGDFFGVKQSGMPIFKIGDIVSDSVIMEEARSDARMIWQEPDWQEKSEWQRLLSLQTQLTVQS